MSRSRRLLHFPDSPERECLVDRSGLQLETLECSVDCSTSIVYDWISNGWSDCILFPSDVPASCGLGYETTTYTCNGTLTGDPAPCAKVPQPPTARPCAIQCPDRCLLTHWTDYSICENNRQNRTREIIPIAGSDDWMSSCPEYASLSMKQSAECTPINLDDYDYSVLGQFSETIIDDPYAVCGNGYDYRTVACINMFALTVHDEEFCEHREIGDDKLSIRPSSIKCDIDCVQNEWSDWSPCSSTCGYGYRTRDRSVKSPALPGGRPCGPHQEMDVCYTQPCRYAQYTPGAYSTCRASNTTSLCGAGVRTREPLCLVNNVIQDTTIECEGVAVNFELSEPCNMPCPGDCVVSEWSEWGPCPTDCPPGACQHGRTRRVLREGGDMNSCMMTQEFRHCEAEVEPYVWSVGMWGDCTIGPVDVEVNAGAYCGKGVQRGAVLCVHSQNNETVFDGLCVQPKPMDVRSCIIPCPVDCIVEPFSDWSPCPGQCERTPAMQSRRRGVVVAPMFGGRSCPQLEQTRSCLPVNCTEYVVETRESHYRCDLDLTSRAQCGRAAISKPLSCRRNAQYLDLSVCMEAVEQGIAVRGSELLPVEECSQECPRVDMCTYSNWTEWSDCNSLCGDGTARFNFRTRALISSHSGSEADCESMQYEVNECPMLEPALKNSTGLIPFNVSDNCISLQWQTTEFDSTGTRNVQCVSERGQSVTSGCPLDTKPSSVLLSCEQVTCPPYSDCVGGACECVPGLEAVGGLCLPVRGCKDDDHCLYSSTECVAGECVCRHNFIRMDGRCVYIGPPTTPTSLITTATDDETTGTMTTGDVMSSPSTQGDTNSTTPPPTDTAATLGILPIVLISTIPLVVIILVIIILIVIMYRCHKRLEGSHKINSLKHRRDIKISAPSPVHSLDRYHRGADSASSGFVDDVEHDHFKYGMAGKTFLSSRRMMPSSREDIDEAAFTAEFPAQVPPSPHPIPIAVPTLPGYQLQHIGLDYLPRAGPPTEIPDGDFTTDVAYTTDDGSLVTTSVPPSSVGSPNLARRHAHQQFTSQSQETYVPMQPIYTQVTPRSQRQLDESHDWEGRSHDRSHDHFERNISPNRSVRSSDHGSRVRQDHRDRLQSNSSYDYREYRGGSHDHNDKSHDQRGRSQSAGRDYKVYEHERERYYSGRRDYRSPSPKSRPAHQKHPRGIATGLDNSLVQAISQMSGREGTVTPSHSVRSAGSRGSQRRRKRRYQGQPHHMTYNSRYRYGSDGPSDQDLTSASEAEQSYARRIPSRSLPISPPSLTDPDEPDYDTLPTPNIKVSPATPINRIGSPDHTPQNRVALLRTQRTQQGHYDYPRCFQQSPPESSVATSTLSQQPKLTRVTPPTSPLPQMAQPSTSTRYEHLVPLKLSPAVEGSPLSTRRHPPSPLALHSEGVITPRSSAEVKTFDLPQESTNGQ